MTLDNDPLWYKNAIFYELHIRAFSDSNGDGKGDLLGIIPKLDYLQELGVTCIWLLPMFPSPLKDDGYDIVNYYDIDPDYGTIDDFKQFLAEAHARGIRVITDLVLNHTSDQHPWFAQSRRSKDSSYRDYYVWSDTDQKYRDARVIFVDTEPSNWTFDETTSEYYWHRFFASQPDLNFDNPVVADKMIEIMTYWMSMGIDGFRLDAVPYLFEREGTNCENLPETHAYLKRVRAVISAEFPQAILLGEANQWPLDLRPYFGGDPEDPSVDGDELHMAFRFPVMPRIFKALKTGDVTDIIDIMTDRPPIPHDCQWCVFLRNHDELTLEMVTEEDRQFMWSAYAPDLRMRLNLGIRRRLAPLLDNDRRKIEVAHSVLFTLRGTPVLYYGDEIGMGDNIWLFDRNGVRTPMQWTAEPGAGFSASPPETFYLPLIEDEVFGYQKVNVAAQRADPDSLFNLIKRMIAVRQANPFLGEAWHEFLATGSPAVLAVLRQADQAALLSLQNLSDQDQVVTLDLAAFAGVTPQELLDRRAEPWPEITGQPYRVALKPYDYYWLRLK